MTDLITRTAHGVTLNLPADLVRLLSAVELDDDGTHPLTAAHPGPLAVVPGADVDPFDALEQEFATDAMLAARAEMVAAQRTVVGQLAATPADPFGMVSVELSEPDAASLLAWFNRTYVRLRTAEVGSIAVGGGQSALGMLGFDDEEIPETGEVPFSMLAGLFAALTSELLTALH